MSKNRYIGIETPRPEGGEKAAGKSLYIHDIKRPQMLYGKVKFSEYAHARIININTSKAEKLPGVKAVITAFNTPEIRIGFMQDNFALKKDKVRQFRDEVAAVAAIDPEIAKEAVSLIEVEYEPLEGVYCPHEAMKDDSPLIHEIDPRGKEVKSNIISLKYEHLSGNVELAHKNSKYEVNGSFSTQLIQQCCMGTAGAIAEFDLSNNLTIWAKTQIPFLAQKDFNKALNMMGLKGKNTRVIVPALGGGFGTGLDTHAYEYITILLAHRTGRPVKILYNRDEEFANLSPRQSSEIHISQGCDENGKLTYREVDVLQDNGAYVSWGATYPTVMLLPATSLYRVENVSFKAKLVYTNNTYCQAMRGYGNPEVNWAIENNMDELAEKAGIDPFEFRRINCNEPGETSPMGLKVTTCGLKECLLGTASKIKWEEKRGKQKNKKRGVGMASLFHVGGSGRIYRSDASGIILRLDDFGNVYVNSGSVEMGQGIHSVITLGIAESLGVLPEKVFINQTDTSTCPWDVGTHASRGAFTALNAANEAVSKLRERIFTLAEDIYPKIISKSIKKLQKKNPEFLPVDFDFKAAAKKDNFELFDSVLFLKNAPNETYLKLGFDKFLRSIHFRSQGQMLVEEAFYDPPNELPDFIKGYGNMSATYSYGTQGVEVEVDEETGEIKILKFVAVHDVGKVLNPQTLKGQMYGALAQGIGYALYEEIKSDKGKILNTNFQDYKIPTVLEMDFPIEIEFIETDDKYGPFGSKGVGEPGLVPTAPAIANAVYDAVGIRVYDLPMTPEKVLKAIKEKKKTEI